jgi:hypothetical protein
MCYYHETDRCPNAEKNRALEARLDKLEEFIWENYVEPECEYKHSVDLKFMCDHDLSKGEQVECSAGLAPRCDQDVCPIFRTKY